MERSTSASVTFDKWNLGRQHGLVCARLQ